MHYTFNGVQNVKGSIQVNNLNILISSYIHPPKATQLFYTYDFAASLVNAVVVCLRESHRCRATFRKCGGFNSLLSIILSLDQCLSFKHSDQNSDSKDVNDDLSSILLLLRSVFNCLAVAMRFEPANAKFFQVSENIFGFRTHAHRTHACMHYAHVCACATCF